MESKKEQQFNEEIKNVERQGVKPSSKIVECHMFSGYCTYGTKTCGEGNCPHDPGIIQVK